MQELQPGQNRPIGPGRVTLVVGGEPEELFRANTQAGVAVLGGDGRLRDFGDLVGADQPRSRDGAVVLAAAPGTFHLDLDTVAPEVARLALVLAVRPELPPGTTFGVFSAIRTWLTDSGGQVLLAFPLPLSSRGETAMILAEVYRYQGQWKFRAVGQGFAQGLPALAAHFGLRWPEPERPVVDRTEPRREPSPPSGKAFSGTGFCVHPEGYVLTNYHVIDGASEILARSPRHRGRLEPVFVDPTNDLALLRATAPLPGVAAFRAGPQARLGEVVVVIGYPLGGLLGSGPQVTTGNVSALIGPGDDSRFLQFTAPTQAGNSGGPLLDGDGTVVGVVSAKLNAIQVHALTGDVPQNVNFALKTALVRSFLEAAGVDYQSRPPHPARPVTAIADEARAFVLKIECQAG